jgi:4-hydroxy-tetrahydrodipicolinate synthase
MLDGCYTALVTPFSGDSIDQQGLEQLVAFQIENGVDGILAVGTTGESPVLSWDEHNQVIELVAKLTDGKALCIAGVGSNNTAETLAAAKHAVASGAGALLLVDPYYNGPSSVEIRREYVAPVAKAFPDTTIIPYVIPGRTGAQLLPEDLALLFRDYANVNTVKEATANADNMRRTRFCCGPDFAILSGDDGMTHQMLSDPHIGAAGVISVASNIAPKAVGDMVRHFKAGRLEAAQALNTALAPLFGLVTIKTAEETEFGQVLCRARNPLGIKTLMQILGMPAGPCRQPLGRMTPKGLEVVLAAARKVWVETPDILQPVADHFGLDISARLEDSANWQDLFYASY